MSRLQSIKSAFAKVFGFFQRVLRAVFGSFQYQPPGWLRFIGGKLAATARWLIGHPKHVVASLAVLAVLSFAGWRGYKWYESRPKPVEMSVRIESPDATRIEENAKPDVLRIHFGASAVPIDKVKKPVAIGVKLEPAVPGAWEWTSDKILTFTPKQDWPVGENFVVTLAKTGLLREGVTLKDYELQFQSAVFSVSIPHTEFHQDPQDQNLKKVVATVKFSHPVVADEFEKHLALDLISKKDGKEISKAYRFQVSYDKLRAHAFVHSDPLQIPDRESQMVVRVGAGLRAARGGKGTKEETNASVTVPGLYDFLRIKESNLTLVNNAQYEPEQVLLVDANTGISESEMRRSINAFLLPLRPLQDKSGSKEPYTWSAYEVSKDVLAKSQPVRLDQIANERDYATLHSFRYQADVGRTIYVQVKHGLRSWGGYILDKDYDATLRVPDFPQELKIMQSGALLSLSGEKKVSLYTRDVQALRVELGRVLPGQIHHLVAQNTGNFQSPEFYNYRFNAENITELFSEVIKLPELPHGKPQYAAVDVDKYIEGKGEDRRGLFLLKVDSWDAKRKMTAGKTDSRLILVTDLGMVVKDNGDGSHDVFIQSLASGEPVKGAKIEVIGKNGLAVLSETSDGDGHARFPKLTSYTREKSPLMYLVRKGSDLSFLPYDRHDRYLNLSRFPVEGVRDEDKPGGLSAYMFSDRGIYRPGDEIRVGLIVKGRDWKQSLAGVPLEVTVEDSRAMIVKHEKIRLSESGFEEIKHVTQDASPTGTWNIHVYVVKDGHRGSLLGTTSVRVQEFLPDRLKISARLSADSVEGWVSPQGLEARVSLQNLFGTPATGRKVKALLELSPTFPIFSKFRDYRFSDPMRAKEGVSDHLDEEETDEHGEAKFELNLARFAAATYRVRFLANGFEAEGGRSVAAEAQVTVSPMPYLVGWKTDGDLHYVGKGSERTVQLVAVGPQGGKVAANGLRALVLERKYLSVLTKQWNGTYKYVSVKKEIPVNDKQLSIPEAGLKYTLPSDKPGDFLLVLKNEKDQELNRVEWTVAGTANVTRSLEKNAELQLVLKNPDVEAGSELELQIKAPYTGAGLITVERDRVLAYKWFKTTTTASVQTITVPEDLEGNGYVTVSFIRGLDSPEVFMSPLSYGVAPFTLSRAKRTAKISLQTQDLLKPGENFKMKYTTDRPAKIVVFAVDEGILQVAKYKTPDPLAYFFQKRALEVKTAQILDLLLPEYSRLVNGDGVSAPGGDGENAALRNLNPFKRRRDKPVAYWSGIIDASQKERELSYPIPDHFNGKLRVMAVAVAPDAVGVFSKGALVRGDFVLSPNVPTFVAPGDEFEVSVTVANNIIGSGKDADVNLELKTSKHLEALSPGKVALKISEMRETSATFKLRATSTLGSGNLTFVASRGNKSGRYSVDLSVRPAAPLLTTTVVGHVKGGQATVAVPRKMYADYRINKAGISALPLGLAHGLKQYLEKFPHGCTEQLVSQGMPALVLRTRPEFGFTPEAAEGNVQATLTMLRSRQNDDGGFGLWVNASQVSDFASVYATHYLIEAKDRGVAVPPDVLKSALGYVTQLASRETDALAGERLRAYAVYVLTRSGVVTSQYLSSVQKTLENSYKTTWKKDLAAVYLAGAYKLLKQERKAQALIADLKFGEVTDAEVDYENYYDPLTRDAQLLHMLARHFPERLAKIEGDALLSLVTPITQNRYNTLSSAYSILALEAYAQVAEAQPATGFSIMEVAANGQQKALALPQGLFPVSSFSPEVGRLLVGSTGPLRAYYQVTQSGFDLNPPADVVKQKLEVFREYVGADGKPITQVKLGDEVEVRVKLRSLSNATLWNLAIIDLLPGGFEVVVQPPETAGDPEEEEKEDKTEDGSGHHEGSEGGEGDGEPHGDGDGDGDHAADSDDKAARRVHPTPSALPFAKSSSTWTPEFGDVREDRVILYGSVGSDIKEFVYTIKATNLGTYAIPPLQGEGMYDRGVLARSLGGKLTVVK